VTPGAIRGGFENDARDVPSVAATFAREHGFVGRGDLDPQLEPGTSPTIGNQKVKYCNGSPSCVVLSQRVTFLSKVAAMSLCSLLFLLAFLAVQYVKHERRVLRLCQRVDRVCLRAKRSVIRKVRYYLFCES
jgi:hypothetical protein